MKTIIKILIITSLLFVGSCDLDKLDNPNRGDLTKADVELMLNSTQIKLSEVLTGRMNSSSFGYTRMLYQFGDYVASPSTFDRPWKDYYADLLADTNILINLAENDKLKLYKQAGIAKIIKAYATLAMVDFFGDIPYSEALQGSSNVNPKADKDNIIYDKIYLLLDEAIANLQNSDAESIDFTDLYFDGDFNKWITLAKTIKFKMYVQTRKYNEALSKNGINSLLAEGDLIDSKDKDFEFKYGTSVSNPDARHPLYASNYNSGGAGTYMSNSFMYELKNLNDPRLNYYFFRQTSQAPSGSDLVCDPNNSDIFCYIGNAYWGRDHATTAGVPNDNDKRTTWGLYPVGGKFDADNSESTSSGLGAGGAGIHPILLSSFVDFLKAEAALTIPGVTGDPANLFESAIRKSFEKVQSFGNIQGANVPDSYVISDAQITNFVDARLAEFNAASSTNEKLEILMKQYWVALWGNGLESYNNYRRTGFPILQSPLTSGTIFPRVNLYPSAYTNSNSNANPQPITNQVFWDTNAANFID